MFHVLTTYAGDAEGGVVDSLPDGVPANWKLNKGMRLSEVFPAGVSLRFSRNYPDGRILRDFVSNTMRLLIVSRRVASIFFEQSSDSIELLRVSIRDHEGVVIDDDYSIMNVVSVVDAIDMDKSKYVRSTLRPSQIADMDRLALRPIPSGSKIFRASAMTHMVLAHQDLIDRLSAISATGHKAYVAEGWNGIEI